MDIAGALYAALAAAPAVTEKLATHAGQPAIFTAHPVPRGAARPYLVIGLVAETPADSLDRARVEAVYDVSAVADATGSEAPIEALAAAVSAALHRRRLAPAGGPRLECWRASTSVLPADVSFVGRVVTIQIREQ